MFKLTRLIIMMIMTLTSLIIAARLLGESKSPHPNALLQVMFTNPDGSSCKKPCLFGIHPGVVQQAEDHQRMAQFSWIKDPYLINGNLSGWFDIAGQNYTFFASEYNLEFGLEDWDRFARHFRPSLQPTLEDVVATFGVPTLVCWYGDTLEFWYGNDRMFIYFDTTTVIARNALLNSAIYLEGVEVYPSGNTLPKDLQPINWTGFAHISQYNSR